MSLTIFGKAADVPRGASLVALSAALLLINTTGRPAVFLSD